MNSHTGNICLTVHFQMSHQIACLRGCILTLDLLDWVFSTMLFQMSPQIACLKGCKLTLVAFVCLFSWYIHTGCLGLTFLQCVFLDVSWNGLPKRMHIAYSHWLHLFDFSPLCIFRCVLKSPDQEDLTIDWLHSFGFFPMRVFKYLHNTHFVQKWIGRIKRELSSPSFWSRSTSYQFSCGPHKVS